MSDSDRKIIVDNAYKLTSSKEWHEELKKAELDRKEEVLKDKEQAVRELGTKENDKHLEAISIEKRA